MKQNLLIAALIALGISACETGPGSSGHPITPDSVDKVFGGRKHSAAPSDAEAAVMGPVVEVTAPRYVPAISPKGCPNEARVVMTWNGGNLGKKKTGEAIDVMVDVTRGSDVVLFQEVGTQFGAQAVAKIQDGLLRSGSKWDMSVSSPTLPRNAETEAYGALWKTSRTEFDKPASGLVDELRDSVSREPYRTVFLLNGKLVPIYSFHAVPTRKKPIREVRELVNSKELRDAKVAIVVGDFNLSAKEVDPLFEKIGFRPAISGKTSLKNAPDAKGEYRNRDYDHVYVKGLSVCDAGIVDFPARDFAPVTAEALAQAKTVSDHLPGWVAVY